MKVVLRWEKSLTNPTGEPSSKTSPQEGPGRLRRSSRRRPAGDGVAEVLQVVQHAHGDVLDAVLVAGDQAAADSAVVGVLPLLVQLAGGPVQPLDRLHVHG